MPPKLMSRRKFLRLAVGGTVEVAVVGAVGGLYSTKVEPGWVDIVHKTLTLPRLAAEFDGFRLLQFSDLHTDGYFMTGQRLHDLVQTVNQQQADLVALTGDFVTANPIDQLLPDIVAALKLLNKPTLAILGNHDHWTDAAKIRQVIKDSGLIELSNTVYTIRRGSAALHFGGVDDIWEHQDRLDQVLDQLPDSGAAILLAHEPDFADIASQSRRFDLQLSGHSHGGQVRIPFVGPLVRIDYAKKYPDGQYQVGSMIQYTNRGLGMVSPQVRFNCRPEITVFTLKSPAIYF